MVVGEICSFFVLLLRFWDGLAVSDWVALTPAHNALRSVLRSWVRTIATVGQNRNLGFMGLGIIVPIRTGLGTMAELVGSVVSLVNFRNYLGVVIGTWHILADLYWLVCDDI